MWLGRCKNIEKMEVSPRNNEGEMSSAFWETEPCRPAAQLDSNARLPGKDMEKAGIYY
jgi:hypothetical protein